MKVLKEIKNPYIEANKRRNMGLFLLLIAVGIILIIIGFSFMIRLLLVAWIPFVVSILFLRRYYTWEAGIRGEKAVVRALRELNNSYYLLNGIVLPRRKGDVDHILLGPKGVFVIETKNYSGKVICNGDDWYRRRWRERKSVRIDSVSEQARRNASDLRNFIQEHTRINTLVSPICVFVNPSVVPELKKPTLPVLRLEELTRFIRDTQSSASLKDQEVRNLSDCIIKGTSR